ncbi:MAG: arsenate reductase (glutaredoxin) [Chloroflexota bacterium]
MKTTIYHNARCSKSRGTLEILTEKGINPTIVNYLEDPPTKVELKRILGLLGKKPQEIIRFQEKPAQEQGLTKEDDRSEEAWLEIMVQYPMLIERPIVVVDDKAVIGRPPETVLTII